MGDNTQINNLLAAVNGNNSQAVQNCCDQAIQELINTYPLQKNARYLGYCWSDMFHRDEDQNTPLMIACLRGSDKVQCIIETVLTINMLNFGLFACSVNLVKFPWIKLNVRNNDGHHTLQVACQRNDPNCIRAVLAGFAIQRIEHLTTDDLFPSDYAMEVQNIQYQDLVDEMRNNVQMRCIDANRSVVQRMIQSLHLPVQLVPIVQGVDSVYDALSQSINNAPAINVKYRVIEHAKQNVLADAGMTDEELATPTCMTLMAAASLYQNDIYIWSVSPGHFTNVFTVFKDCSHQDSPAVVASQMDAVTNAVHLLTLPGDNRIISVDSELEHHDLLKCIAYPVAPVVVPVSVSKRVTEFSAPLPTHKLRRCLNDAYYYVKDHRDVPGYDLAQNLRKELRGSVAIPGRLDEIDCNPTICFIGKSGWGKSSIISTAFGVDILPMLGDGNDQYSTTKFPIHVTRTAPTPDNNIAVQVKFYDDMLATWKNMVASAKAELEHIREEKHLDEHELLGYWLSNSNLYQACRRIASVICCMNNMRMVSRVSCDLQNWIIQHELEIFDDSVAFIQPFLETLKHDDVVSDDPAVIKESIKKYTFSGKSYFVKDMMISGSFNNNSCIIPHHVTVIDLPGLADVDSQRDAVITETALKCSHAVVVCPWGIPITNDEVGIFSKITGLLKEKKAVMIVRNKLGACSLTPSESAVTDRHEVICDYLNLDNTIPGIDVELSDSNPLVEMIDWLKTVYARQEKIDAEKERNVKLFDHYLTKCRELQAQTKSSTADTQAEELKRAREVCQLKRQYQELGAMQASPEEIHLSDQTVASDLAAPDFGLSKQYYNSSGNRTGTHKCLEAVFSRNGVFYRGVRGDTDIPLLFARRVIKDYGDYANRLICIVSRFGDGYQGCVQSLRTILMNMNAYGYSLRLEAEIKVALAADSNVWLYIYDYDGLQRAIIAKLPLLRRMLSNVINQDVREVQDQMLNKLKVEIETMESRTKDMEMARAEQREAQLTAQANREKFIHWLAEKQAQIDKC